MDTDDFDLSPPPFRPDAALVQLRRSLRDLKLAERGNGFELRGKRVAELIVDVAAINVRLTRTLAITPQWDSMSIRSATEQRKFIDELKKRLARWAQDD